MKHLWAMMHSKPKEWKRIAKTLHVMDYLVKNGAPRVIADIKDDLYKIRQFESFCYKEPNGLEQGVELRDKVKGLVELINDPSKLQYEREFAKQTRDKFMGISSSGNQGGGSNVSMGSAAPASGNKYGGFGSQDIAKMGYNNEEKFGTSGAYDPYTKTQSTTTQVLDAKKEEKKKTVDDSDDDSDLSDPDSDDSEATRKKKKKALKRK